MASLGLMLIDEVSVMVGISRIAILLIMILCVHSTAFSTMLVTAVNAHGFKDVEKELKLIKDANFDAVRVDVTWEKVEHEIGTFSFDYYDHLLSAINRAQLRPILIVAYSNSNYSKPVRYRDEKGNFKEKVAAPTTNKEIAGYVNFISEVANRYKRFDPIIEIWNEPDLSEFWPPKGSFEAYEKLANESCRVIKKYGIPMIGPGLANVEYGRGGDAVFLKKLANSDLSSCFTAISVHPYIHNGKLDSTKNYWDGLKKIFKPERKIELVSSETGISTFNNSTTEATQAKYYVKMIALNRVSGVNFNVWYSWMDAGDDKKEPNQNFGLIDTEFRLKPVYHAASYANLFFKTSKPIDTCKIDSGLVLLKTTSQDFIRGVLWMPNNASLESANAAFQKFLLERSSQLAEVRNINGEEFDFSEASITRHDFRDEVLYIKLASEYSYKDWCRGR